MEIEGLVVGSQLARKDNPLYTVTITNIREGVNAGWPQRRLYEVGWGFDPTSHNWLDEEYLLEKYALVSAPGAGDPGRASDLEPAGDAAPGDPTPTPTLTQVMNDLGEVATRCQKLGLEDLAQEVARIANSTQRREHAPHYVSVLGVKEMVDALRVLGFTVTLPEPTRPEIKHGWDGQGCPKCGVDDPRYGSSIGGPEAGMMWQAGDCDACGAAWTEMYTLLRAEEAVGGDVLALTFEGDVIASVVGVREKLQNLRGYLFSVGASPSILAQVDSILELLPDIHSK